MNSVTKTLIFHPVLWAVLAGVLAIPLIGGAPWTAFDFIVGGALLAMLGIAIEVGLNASRNRTYQLGAIAAALTGFFIVWANVAVGFVGEPDNPYNLLFVGVLAVAIIGTLAARFKAQGMRNAMGATLVAQIVAGLVAMGQEEAILLLTAMVSLGWAAAALLFAKAAEEGA